MPDHRPDPTETELAAEILQKMLGEAEKTNLCPHCVGLDVIYFISREMTAHLETDPGELFRVLHVGITEGEDMQLDEEVERDAEDTPGSVH